MRKEERILKSKEGRVCEEERRNRLETSTDRTLERRKGLELRHLCSARG